MATAPSGPRHDGSRRARTRRAHSRPLVEVGCWELGAGSWELEADSSLQRYVPVLLGRVGVALVAQHFQSVAQAWPGKTWFDHVVDVPARGGDERVREFLAVLGHQLRLPPLGVL